MTQPSGRWPPDVVVTHSPECVPGECVDWCVAVELDKQSGNRPGAVSNGSKTMTGLAGTSTFRIHERPQVPGYGDSGGCSRFFPQFWHHTNPPTTKRRTTVQLIHGDCLDALRNLPDCTVDAVVTDPPAGIAFMGKHWDGDKGGRDLWIAWLAERLAECLRVLKPGGHAVVWALPRTSGWTHRALEDAGFDVRDCVHHLFGSGFPKSANVSKLIDKAAGVEREVVGQRSNHRDRPMTCAWDASLEGSPTGYNGAGWLVEQVTAPATPAAQQWDGWGTALKPAVEHWWLARKPLDSTVAGTVTRWGTGALNIDGCRVTIPDGDSSGFWTHPHVPAGTFRLDGCETVAELRALAEAGAATPYGRDARSTLARYETLAPAEVPAGRWPADVVLTHNPTCDGVCSPGCAVAELDQQSGTLKSGEHLPHHERHVDGGNGVTHGRMAGIASAGYGDSGGASRFFATFRYQAKPSTREKSNGLDDRNHHPTTKPAELMRWLCRLVTPPGGTVLDPFAGSGTTGVAAILEGFDVILVEAEAEYLPLIEGRVRWAESQVEQPALSFD